MLSKSLVRLIDFKKQKLIAQVVAVEPEKSVGPAELHVRQTNKILEETRLKRSTIASFIILICYVIVSGIIISGVADSFGSDSLAMYITVVAIGPIGLILLGTHKGLNTFLKNLDGDDE